MSIWLTKSNIIGFNHAFFGREGGVSEGVYKSLNVASQLKDNPEHVATNRERALGVVHMDINKAVFLAKLPHSNEVVSVSSKAKGLEFTGYDIITTNESDLPIALYTADCMPIVYSDEVVGAIAICHAGWRGVVAEAPVKAIEAMVKEYGSNPENLKVAIGPSISPDVYVVEKDVASRFDERYLEQKGDSTFLDLWTAAEDQLIKTGVRDIENLKIDTYSDDHYFSYRQDDGDTGRNLTAISL